jgi:hypothetical protein
MRYTKPELVLAGSALAAIQGHDKNVSSDPDGIEPPTVTTGAYEADE